MIWRENNWIAGKLSGLSPILQKEETTPPQEKSHREAHQSIILLLPCLSLFKEDSFSHLSAVRVKEYQQHFLFRVPPDECVGSLWHLKVSAFLFIIILSSTIAYPTLP
jgi:hypothetical protein